MLKVLFMAALLSPAITPADGDFVVGATHSSQHFTESVHCILKTILMVDIITNRGTGVHNNYVTYLKLNTVSDETMI